MSYKKHTDYYPNSIYKNYQFEQRLINKNKFEAFFESDKRNERYTAYQYRKAFLEYKIKVDQDQIIEEYINDEFRIWEDWIKAGRNIFDFSDNLIEMLKETDVSEIELPFIKLPYSSFYIDLSSANLKFADDKSNPVVGVYVREYVNEMIDEEITYERVINLDFTGNYIESYKHINQNLMEMTRGFHSYSLYFDPKFNIYNVGQAVNDAKDSFYKVGMVSSIDNDLKLDIYNLHSNFIKKTLNLAINCLLYLTTKDKDIEEKFTSDLPLQLRQKLDKANTKKRREAVIKDIGNSGFTKVKFVGNNIKRINKYLDSTGQISPHWRRGHWRNQKMGEGLQERKLIWIMPTIVNKKLGSPDKGHVYNVNESK